MLYAISTGGEIVRRFTVDPGDPVLYVAGMAITGNRAAIVFRKGGQGNKVERRWNGADLFRSEGYGGALFSQRARDWFTEHWGMYVLFDEFATA